MFEYLEFDNKKKLTISLFLLKKIKKDKVKKKIISDILNKKKN